MQQLISIIVPIYNAEKYLRQCLDSIVNQTYKELEIILVDDGSPDNCGKICDEYAAVDDRLVVIHKENAGVSVARNDGIERATGEWVMFVDPDDWLELDCCARVSEVAEKGKQDVIYFQREMDDEQGKCIIKYPKIDSFCFDEKKIEAMRADCYIGKSETFGFQSIVPWAKLFRREFLVKNTCRFPVGLKKRQDIIFNLYCQEYLKSAYYFDYVGYHNRLNPKSTCNRYSEDILSVVIMFLKELTDLIQKFHSTEPYYRIVAGVQSYCILADVEKLYFFFHIER